MIIPDLNLPLYAHDAGAPNHAAARTWWEEALNGEEVVGLGWTCILGFIRIATNPRLFARPLAVEVASQRVRSWLDCPAVRIVDPGPRHAEILLNLIAQVGTAGNLTGDAHLAAIAIEHGATLYSTDRDFGRFPGLVWVNPLGDPAPPASRSKRRAKGRQVR